MRAMGWALISIAGEARGVREKGGCSRHQEGQHSGDGVGSDPQPTVFSPSFRPPPCAESSGLSSVHVTFNTAEEWAALAEVGFLQRTGIQVNMH